MDTEISFQVAAAALRGAREQRQTIPASPKPMASAAWTPPMQWPRSTPPHGWRKAHALSA